MAFGQILEVDVANGTWTTDFMKQLSKPTGEDFFYRNKIKTLHSTYLLFAYLVDGQRVELSVPFTEEKEKYPASHVYI